MNDLSLWNGKRGHFYPNNFEFSMIHYDLTIYKITTKITADFVHKIVTRT